MLKLNYQGNKLVTISENMFASWTMLTELNLGTQKYQRCVEIMWFNWFCIKLTFRSLQQKICLQPPRIVSEHFLNLFAWTCIRIVSLSTMLLHVRILKFKSSIELMASYLFFVRNNINSSFHKGLLFSCWALYGVGSVLMACLAFFFALHLAFCDVNSLSLFCVPEITYCHQYQLILAHYQN